MAKKGQPKRTMRLHKMDGSFIDLEITKATSVDTKQSMINLDKLADGTWRLVWDKNLLAEFSDFKSLEMIREDVGEPLPDTVTVGERIYPMALIKEAFDKERV
jgi:hypothetical protein